MGDRITVEWARLVYAEVERQLASQTITTPTQVIEEIGKHLLSDPDGPHLSDSAFQTALRMIQQAQPSMVLQIGVFVGYQAIQLAGSMPSEDSHYVCFELDPDYAKVARQFISIADMSERIQILVGDENEVMNQFLSNYSRALHPPTIEFIILNHWKHIYLEDLMKLELMGFITEKTIVICDDMVFPGLHQLMTTGDWSDSLAESHDSKISLEAESSNPQSSLDCLTLFKGRHFISRWNAHSTSHD